MGLEFAQKCLICAIVFISNVVLSMSVAVCLIRYARAFVDDLFAVYSTKYKSTLIKLYPAVNLKLKRNPQLNFTINNHFLLPCS